MSTSPAPVAADPSPEDLGRLGSERRDLLIAGGYAALVLLLAASGASNSGVVEADERWPLWLSVTLMLAGCASMIWRRRRPVVTLAVAGPLAVLEIVVGGQISAYFLLFEALFDPVMHGSHRLARATTALAVAAGAIALITTVVINGVGPILLVVMMVTVLVVTTPLLWGWEVRHHRGAREAAETLAGLERELAATRAVHAVETERRQIAHDLHDVIAGHLSAVSLHTNLAASLEDEQARGRSLVTARESAHAALRDLRSIIGVLSSEESGALPTATLDWPSLEARLRGRDPAARVEIDPAATDPARVDPSVQAALLRIAAEAVTNAVQHGRAPISLVVRAEADAVTLELVNGLAEQSEPGAGVGRGAISHRATAVGGTAVSEPMASDAGESEAWRVHACLPVGRTEVSSRAAQPAHAGPHRPTVSHEDQERTS
ncbi:sensor histidine kinase [Brachybacterium sp. GCM10030268]|uniref:sensor histidine kinase n=1 Tax=Brachybacterium sp. GCM10030268 TaxID=3273382 RepID=UPI0036243155